MPEEEGVNWATLIASTAFSIVASVASAVIINELIRRKREAGVKKPAGQTVRKAEPRILEEDGYFVIEHHVEAECFSTTPLLGGIAELGLSDGRLWLRRLWLPKSNFTREQVKSIMASMNKCRLCSEGMPLPASTKLITLQKPVLRRGSMATGTEIASVAVGAFAGKGVDKLFDYTLVGKLGTLGTNVVKAFTGLVAAAAPLGMPMDRKMELGLIGMGSYLLTSAVDILEELVAAPAATQVQLVPVGSPAPAPSTRMIYTEQGPVDIELG